MKMKKNAGLIIGGVIGALVAATSQAQSASDDATASRTAAADTGGIQEVVVTAQKREQSINDVGISITALSDTQLRDVGVTSTADLAKVVPGLTYQPSPFNTPVYTLRGVGFYDSTLSASPTVAVYTDEVPLPFSAMTTGAVLDLERVEVLKGPQGTLFGQNTTGGAINYVAAKPTDTFQAGTDVSFGRFATTNVEGFVSGPIADGVESRLATRVIAGGPWQESFTRHDQLGSKSRVESRFLTNWKVNDQLLLKFNINGWYDGSDTQAPQFQGAGYSAGQQAHPNPEAAAFLAYPLAPQNARAADWGTTKIPLHRNDRFFQLSGRADWRLTDNLTFTSITAYSDYRTHSGQEFDGTTLSGADTVTSGYIRSGSEELRLTGAFSKTNWIVGANYEKDNTYDRLFYFFGDSQSSDVAPGLPKGNTTFNYSQQDVKTAAAFANVEQQLIDRLSVVGGVRYTDNRRAFGGCTNDDGDGTLAAFWNGIFGTNVQPGGCVTFTPNFPQIFTVDRANLNEKNTSWHVGLNFKPVEGSLLYASVSKGYKGGSFPTASVSSYTGYLPVKQESVLAYELGFKTLALNRTLQWSGAAFYYDYKDKQLRGRAVDAVFGALDALVQVPKSEVKGAETQIDWRPVEALRMSLGATYLKTKIKEFTGYNSLGVLANYQGAQFPYAPKLQMVTDAEYHWPVNGAMSAFVGAGATYNSHATATIGDDPRFALRDFFVVDARAGVESADGRIRAAFWGRNLTNRYYWTNVINSQDTIVRYAAMPITYGIEFSYRTK